MINGKLASGKEKSNKFDMLIVNFTIYNEIS